MRKGSPREPQWPPSKISSWLKITGGRSTVWDGLLHAFTWIVTATGLWRLWVAGQRPDVPWSTPTFLGSLAMGWGLFNFVEGMIDHQILGIHHVHPGDGQLGWDLGFLALGLAQIAVGWAAIRAGRADETPRGGLAVQRSSHA